MEKRLSLKNKLLVYFGGILITGLLLNGIVATYLCQNIMVEKVKENLGKAVRDCTEKVNIILDQKKVNMESLGDIPYLYDSSNSIDRKLAFLNIMNQHMGFSNIVYVTRNGDSYSLDGAVGNMADSYEFMEALKGRTVFSRAIEVEGAPGFSIASPIVNDSGKVVAVVMGLETVESFMDIIESVGVTNNFIIMDSAASIISYSDLKTPKQQLYDKSLSSNEAFKTIYHDMLSGKTGVHLVTMPQDGESDFLSYAPFTNGWSIGMFFDEGILMDSVDMFYQVIAFSTAVIIIIGVLGVYIISKNLSVNISEIVHCLDGVASGNFNQPIPEELLGMKDEMGDVARALDGMKSELEEMLSTVRDCTDYMNNQIEDFTGDIKDALHEVVVGQHINREEAEEVLMRIDHFHQITDFMNESALPKKNDQEEAV